MKGEDNLVFSIVVKDEQKFTKECKVTGMSAFELACQKPESAAFIKNSINDGYDVNKLNVGLQKRPIDFAVEALCNLDTLLLEPTCNIDIKCQAWRGMTPINYLASRIVDNNFERIYLFIIRRLVENQANVNIPDDDGITPIWRIITNDMLSNSNKRKILFNFFENSIEVDIDNYQDGKIRNILEKDFPDIKLPPINVRRSKEKWDFSRLIMCLSIKEETEFLRGLNCFIEWNEDDLSKLFSTDNGKFTLLKLAVKNGMVKAVERMLRLGADINFKGKNFVTPIECACRRGFWRILDIFLRSTKIDTSTNESLIWTVIPPMVVDDGADIDKEIDFAKCFQILMRSPKVDVDYVNSSNQTALDTAIRLLNGRPDIITALLNKGAYIGIHTKSSFQSYNNFAITNIAPKLLENRLDYCITPIYEKYEDDYFELRFDFRNLASIHYKRNKGLFDALANEMEPINCIAETKGLRHLLHHPLIQAFLFLKWQRLALIFNLNLLVYFVFSTSVLSYVLSTFIYMEVPHTTTSISWWLSLIMTFAIILRELFQFVLSPHLYLRSVQNYLEMTLLAFVILVLCNLDVLDAHRRTVATWTILLVTSELFILLGSLEMFFIHFTMLKSVLVSFLKAFALYVVILVAFALCFFAMLNHSDTDNESHTYRNGTDLKLNETDANRNETTSTETEEKDDDKFSSFDNLGLSLVKIVVMATGEFDAGSINFELNPFSYLLFLVFVFLVSAVLFNLLSGLAVTDIQQIRSEAELTNLMRRVYLLSEYETILCSNHLWCHDFIIKWVDPSRLSIFKHLPQYKVKVDLTDRNRIYRLRVLYNKEECHPLAGHLYNSRMPKKILELVEQILRKRKMVKLEENEKQQLYDRISNIEKVLSENASKLDSVISALKDLQSSKE